MALLYEPNSHLTFNVPAKGNAEDTLKLTNKNSFGVLFKIKTTAPKQFCVRPNAGYLDPNESVEVKIILQVLKDPSQLHRSDKFLVQSFHDKINGKDMGDKEAWSIIDKEYKADVQEKKIRVRYILASGAEGASAASGGSSSQKLTRKEGMSSPIAASLSLEGESMSTPRASSKSPEARESDAENFVEQAPSSPLPHPPHTQDETLRHEPAAAAAATAADAVHSDDQIPAETQRNSELDKAREKINELEANIAMYKRQASEARQLADSLTKKDQGNQQLRTKPAPAEVEGFSFQVVGIVALIAFLVGYWLF